MNFVNSSKKERKKKEENRILSRLEREATKNICILNNIPELLGNLFTK